MTPESEVVLVTQRLTVGSSLGRELTDLVAGSVLTALAAAVGAVLVLAAVVATVLLAPLFLGALVAVAVRSDRRLARR